jgi:hypothetical protein
LIFWVNVTTKGEFWYETLNEGTVSYGRVRLRNRPNGSYVAEVVAPGTALHVKVGRRPVTVIPSGATPVGDGNAVRK